MMMQPPQDAIVIGICTFRRASVADTLASLAGLAETAHPLSIIVADNDDSPTAAAAIARIAVTHPVPLRYIHAPARNISVARNAILEASLQAGARYLAFLDDDETASPGWLAALLQRHAATEAAAVVGPVRALYAPDAPGWMQRGAVHDTTPELDRAGLVREAYTSNVLLDLAVPALRQLRFDPARGKTGGEDTAFFRALKSAGGRIAFAPDAVVQETVPAERAVLRWLLRRRYRMGQTHGSLIIEGRGLAARTAAIALAALKAGACLGLTGLRIFDPLGRNLALMRGALHVGAVAELIGLDRVEIYGNAPPWQVGREPVETGK
ncbi:glycosyltransferase family 2 protein [Tabrizicola sp.]|uniref:glycosyltransferase family 2 protein n=1 Tax=Tabrizicola sp. TaxID=2005166 RepID=UPI003F2F7B2D